MTRSHRLCGIVMLLAIAGSRPAAADDKPCGQGGKPMVVEKLPAPGCKVCRDSAASVCVDARVCYTEEGLRTFAAIFQAAAAQGVENAIIRAMNQTQIASPLKELQGQAPAKEAKGKGGDKGDDDKKGAPRKDKEDDGKDGSKDKDDDDKKDRRDDKDHEDDGDKDRPKEKDDDDSDKKGASSKDKDDRDDKDDDDKARRKDD